MAFTHLHPGNTYIYLNNLGEVAAQIVYENDSGSPLKWVAPDGTIVPPPPLAVSAPTVQNVTLYQGSGNIKQIDIARGDGSGIVLDFADTNLIRFAFGPGSGPSAPGGIYEHGPLLSSVETSASGYTIAQTFSQNHLVDYRFDYNDLHIVGTYDIGTDTYSISLQNSVHTTPLVATGGGNIDPFVRVISNDGSSLISQDGAGLISPDQTGINLIYNGAAIISDHASGLNLLNIASLISQDGAGVISNDGSSLISQDGAGITIGPRAIGNGGFIVGTINSDLAGDEGAQFLAHLDAILVGVSAYTGPITFTSGPDDDNTDFRIAVGGSRVDKIDFLGEVDLWTITNDAGNAERQLIAGQTYLIDLKGTSSDSGTLIDPFLRVYAADKTTVVAETDDGGAGFNSRLLFTPSTTGFYYVEAGARDDGSFGTYTLTVQDPSPVIDSNGGGDTAGILIAENTDIVTTVTANDPDSGTTLQYSITGGADASKFGINTTNGILYFLTPPDFELPNDADHNNSYLVDVQASDGTFVDRQLLTVSVTDVNEGTAVPEIAVWGNHTDIVDGNTPPSATNHTAFGQALVGSIVERTFVVINQGSAPLLISKIAVPKGAFSIVEPLNGNIAPGGFDFFTVRMDTSRAGTKSGNIVITSNDTSERTFDFAINGNVVPANPEIAVSGNNVNIAAGDKIPDSSDGTAFGTVVVGGHLDRTFTVTNTGSDPLSITSLTLSSGLTLVGPQPSTIAAGEFATFTVRATPTRVGAFKGTVTINNNDANEARFDFAVSANVVAAPTPEIEVSGNGTDIRDNDRVPDTYDHTDFGLSSYGSAGVIRTFTIHNSGLATLNISQVQLPTGFHLATAAPTSIAAGASAALAVQIDTDATGARSGTVNILSNDSDEATFNFNIAGFVGPQQRTGNGGPNEFVAGAHAEAFFGFGDIDTVSYEMASGPVVANLGAPARNTGFAAGDTYDSIENLTGSEHPDTLTGNAAGNVLEGGIGGDKLDGGSTDASDIDLASYRNAETGVTADLLRSKNNTGEAAGDTYKNIEGLLGSDHNDRLVGNAGRNYIGGFDGDDTIIGNGGEDVLVGDIGADTFLFNAPTDGGGATVVIGVNPQPVGDLIFDFVTGEDHIGILRSAFKIAATLSAVDFAAHYFFSDPGVAPSQGNQAGISATEGDHGQFLFNESTAQLWWDADGTGTRSTPMLLASFASGGHPVASDFLLM